jgi:acyl carrier protein
MPTPAEIREQLTDILGKVADVPTESVRDTAVLKDLGVDSVATVELAEGIGRTFDLRLSDETVNEWRTVGDLVRTVQREEAAQANRAEPVAPPTLTDEERTGAFKQLAIFFALIGAGLGIVVGIGAAALLTSSGLDAGSLPPISTPVIPTALGTASGSATATESSGSDSPDSRFTPPPFNGEEDDPSPTPTPSDVRATSARLTATPTDVAPGERFDLEGALPDATPSESLTIEMRQTGSAWETFPVTAAANPDGTFKTQIYISSAGEYIFRVRSRGARTVTPPVTVRIGS